ncbi:UNVERIFIED_ORG: hypothetical protein HNP28_001072 [Comamonas terrigena]
MGGLQPTTPSTCARKRKSVLQQRALQSTTKPCFSCPTPQTSTPKCPTPGRGLRARRASASHVKTHGQDDDGDVGTTDWYAPHLTKYVSMAMAPVVSSTPTAFATPRLNLPATHESAQRVDIPCISVVIRRAPCTQSTAARTTCAPSGTATHTGPVRTTLFGHTRDTGNTLSLSRSFHTRSQPFADRKRWIETQPP